MNGLVLYKWLTDTNLNVINTNNSFATHVRGNKIDYTILVNDVGLDYDSKIVDELTSDHYGIVTNLQLPTPAHQGIESRKRLTIHPKQLEETKSRLQEWYNQYCAEHEDEDIDALESALTQNTEMIILQVKYGGKTKRSKKCIDNSHRWYHKSEAIKRINKAYRKVKEAYRNNPTQNNYLILQRLIHQSKEVKKNAKEKDWNDFIQGINHRTTVQSIFHKVKILSGKRTREPRHPNPAQKAQELIENWASSSSYDELPLTVRQALSRHKNDRELTVERALGKIGQNDNFPFTEHEFKQALQANKTSTAPGMDGITYEVIRVLSSLEGNPILRLCNLIWKNGRLPKTWKLAVIIPIPKPGKNGDMRPISLTSCLCKVFERLILKRLHYTLKTVLSKNIYGFLPKRSTHHCIHRVRSNTKGIYTVFIDLKGAFEKANPLALLAELSVHVQGKMLSIIKDYLSGREATVHFEGEYSEWRRLELGTPQGGVLSPTLFNVLMDVIARSEMPGVIKTIYADDIVLQAHSKDLLQDALKKFTKICNSIGLVISPTKTKVLTNSRTRRCTFKIQGTVLDNVNYYKYLGVSIGSYKYLLHSLKQSCNVRLNILRCVAGGSIGSSVPTLRLLYIMMIRSVVDYHASNIIDIKKTKQGELEAIQNKAIRIILGCPTSARQENARSEVELQPLMSRVREVAALQFVRSLDTGDDGFFNNTLHQDDQPNKEGGKKRWLNAVRQLLSGTNYKQYIDDNRMRVAEVPPWRIPDVPVSLSSTPLRKADTPDMELRNEFLSRIECLPTNSISCYTDGSVKDNQRAGAGVVIIDRRGRTIKESYFRASDGISSTQTELLALKRATKIISEMENDDHESVLLITDSTSAIQSIQNNTTRNWKLVHSIYRRICVIRARGKTVHLVWTPSHCGIGGNERADRLASKGADEEEIRYALPRPMSGLKTLLRMRERMDYHLYLRGRRLEVPSIFRYHNLTKKKPPDYINNGMHSRPIQTSFSRLRLGYRYLWEVIDRNQGDQDEDLAGEIVTRTGIVINTKCRLCDELYGHNLKHYVEQCRKVSGYRPRGVPYERLLIHFSQPTYFLFLKKKLGEGFLPSR